MRSKLWYLVSVSLKRKIKTKWFIAANLLLAIVIVGIINIDSIIKYFGGDFSEKTPVYVIDNTGVSYDLFEAQLISSEQLLYGDDDSSYEIEKYDKTLEEAKKELEEDKDKSKAIFIEFTSSEENVLNASMLTKEYVDMVETQVLNSAINNTKVALAIAESNISAEEIAKIYSPIEINRIYLDEDKNSTDENMNMIMTTVFPILILPFFMLTIFLVQMIGAEVNDEKTTRGMEIIISNVSPKTHFFSKVIAGNAFVLLQGGLLLAFGGLGLLVRSFAGKGSLSGGMGAEIGDMISNVLKSGIGEKLLPFLGLALILMLLTFLAYSLLAGILASMTTNIEDFQQLQTPIMIISLVGYYLSMMAGMFDGAVFIKILSYIPYISAILSPSLLVMGQIGIIDFMISIILIIVLNYALIKYGLRIYKVGILNYSSKGLWKKMFKALKSK